MQQPDYQDKLDGIDNLIKSLNRDKSAVIKQLETDGFFLDKNGKVSKREHVVGIISKWAYYTKYVSEMGAMYNYEDDAYEINSITLNEIFEKYRIVRDKIIAYTVEVNDILEFFNLFSNELRAFGDKFNVPNEHELKPNNWRNKNLSESEIKINFLNKGCKLFKMFKLDENLRQLSFKYSGTNDVNEYVNNSGFTISIFGREFLQKYKSIHVENSFHFYENSITW